MTLDIVGPPCDGDGCSDPSPSPFSDVITMSAGDSSSCLDFRDDLEAAIAAAKQARAGALNILDSASFFANRVRIVEAARNPAPSHLSALGVRRCRRARLLRATLSRLISAGCHLRRQDSQGGQAR